MKAGVFHFVREKGPPPGTPGNPKSPAKSGSICRTQNWNRNWVPQFRFVGAGGLQVLQVTLLDPPKFNLFFEPEPSFGFLPQFVFFLGLYLA